MSNEKYFYRPLAAYEGKVFKCAGICDADNIDKANEIFLGTDEQYIKGKGLVYLPGFVILDGYKGDKVVIGRDNVAKEFKYGDALPAEFPTTLRKGCYRNNIVDETGIEVARIGLFALNDDSDPTIEAFRDEIVNRYNAPRMVAKIEVRNVFGVFKIYPMNEAAELIAKIAGTKTITNEALAYAERLGFRIEEVATKKLAA